MQALTDIECIGCGSYELRSEPAEKREHLFPYVVNEHNFRQVYDDLRAGRAAGDYHPRVFRIVTGESALKHHLPSAG